VAGPSKQPTNALVAPPAQRSAMDQEKRRHRHILCRPAKALSPWRNNAALRMVHSLRFALGSPLLVAVHQAGVRIMARDGRTPPPRLEIAVPKKGCGRGPKVDGS
jgi:hypothetical protein